MRAYLKWLVESPYGKDEAKNGNNHETWYDVQVAGLAMYTGQPTWLGARSIGARDRIAGRSNRTAASRARRNAHGRGTTASSTCAHSSRISATLSDRASLDLWNYRTADGRSLRKALDYLVPFAAGERKWTDTQLNAFDPRELTPLLRRAAIAWKEPKYRELAERIGGGSLRAQLTGR